MAFSSLRSLARKIPGVAPVYRGIRSLIPRRFIFSRIYASNSWDGKQSISGPGSDLEQTKTIIAELPALFAKFEVRSVLDIPCGDFHWMRHVPMGSIGYVGADIVPALVQQNTSRYQSEHVHFVTLDLIKDRLPSVDLILCRDCLVHLSFKDLWAALQNICDSGATFLLATTFTKRLHNADIATGHWRRLNLRAAPIGLPAPLDVVNERCTEGDGENDDKSLGLWRITDIVKCLPTSQPTLVR